MCSPVLSAHIVTKPCRMVQMAKDPLLRTSGVKQCMAAPAMQDCSVCSHILICPVELELIDLVTERNMYLAEDRILCFEIVAKKREAWV